MAGGRVAERHLRRVAARPPRLVEEADSCDEGQYATRGPDRREWRLTPHATNA